MCAIPQNGGTILVSQALRKSTAGPPAPVLVLEKFETFVPGKGGSRVARGAGLIMFDGFQVDLDAGQVVPAGQGGDLAFTSTGVKSPTLSPVGGSRLFSFTKPPPAMAQAAGPSPGKAILPGDFAGRYRLHSDGRWSGLLELQSGEGRSITGRLRSEPNGTSYEIKGEIAVDAPQKLTFTLNFHVRNRFTRGISILKARMRSREHSRCRAVVWVFRDS